MSPPRCDLCPFAKRGQAENPVPGVGPTRPDAVLVVEAPSREDQREGECLSGRTPAGQQVETLLAEAGLDRERLFIVSALACPIKEPRRDAEVLRAINCCRPRLFEQLARVQGEPPVMSMGDTATLALDGKKKSTAKNRGFIEPDWTLEAAFKNELAFAGTRGLK